FMDSSYSSARSSVSQNSVSSDIVVESSISSSTVPNAFTEEIVAFEKESDETHVVKKLDALCTPKSFVTHSNFDTPYRTVYYILEVSADVLLVKGNVYDSVDDCVVAYMKYATEVGFVVRRSCQKRLRNGDVKQKVLSFLLFFWADEASKYNYKEFGDVVSFDATFKTNKYNMVFVTFTTIDNHRKCVTVAAGLLKNENTKSYIWLLKAFIKAFGKAPSIVVTDQDGAMRNAIEAKFAGSKHRLCMWHITQKLFAKICAKIYDETDFKEKLNKIKKKKKKSQSVDKCKDLGKCKDKAEEDDPVDLFFKKDRLYKVLQNIGDGLVVCSCQLFVRIGILCKNIFCVFENASVEMIPQQYILRRWMKNLILDALRNKRNIYGEKNVVVENFANEATLIVDYCVHLLSKDEPRLGAFVEKLKSLKKDVEADCPNPPSKNKTDNLEQLVGLSKPPVVEVNNPTVGSTKGRKKSRIKGGKEKAIEKILKGRNSCSLCGSIGHNKRTSPGRFKVEDEVVLQKKCVKRKLWFKKKCVKRKLFKKKYI
nr:protein FAR1-related sequence 5 [Tanacetum cinerariifolium]